MQIITVNCSYPHFSIAAHKLLWYCFYNGVCVFCELGGEQGEAEGEREEK